MYASPQLQGILYTTLDFLTVGSVSSEHVELFLGHINSLHPTIKFTMEQEKEGSLYSNGMLRTNGYPEHIIQAAARPRKGTTQEEQPKYTICLPYVAGVGEDLRRVCRTFDIRTVFTTTSTLRQQLTKVKDTDPTLKTSSVVYRIPCS